MTPINSHEEYVSRCQQAAIAMRDLMCLRIKLGVEMSVAQADYDRSVKELLQEIERDYLESLWRVRKPSASPL